MCSLTPSKTSVFLPFYNFTVVSSTQLEINNGSSYYYIITSIKQPFLGRDKIFREKAG